MSLDMTTAPAVETFIRVYRLPTKLTNGFCFGGGQPIEFLNVDWFQIPEHVQVTRDELEKMIKAKIYWDPHARFLVLDSRPGETFVIEPGTDKVNALKKLLDEIAPVQKYGEDSSHVG
jgi:hypothetical protein